MRAFRAAVVLVLALALPAHVLAADLQAGLDAYERGDYAAALKEWRPLAEQGDVVAQYYLGTMYADGEGVPQDPAEATKWFRLAEKSIRANADEPEAQWALGTMYESGWGVPQDYVLAHMWFSLATAQGDEFAGEDRDEVAKEMTPEQIAEAERLAQEWQSNAKNADAFIFSFLILAFLVTIVWKTNPRPGIRVSWRRRER